jgi:hypothetical protein
LLVHGTAIKVVGRWSGFLEGQAIVSAVVEVERGIVIGIGTNLSGPGIPRIHQTATEVVGACGGLLLQGTAIKVVGKWSGFYQAKRSLVAVEARWRIVSGFNCKS